MNLFPRCLILAGLLATAACRKPAAYPGRQPSPELAPLDVVRIQVSALQHYGDPTPNAGIWTAFQFTSPANRRLTGPYGHFLQLIKSPQNRPFLHARAAQLSEVEHTEWFAEVLVQLQDEHRAGSRFLFSLSKQREGAFQHCWMTDAVVRE